MAGHSAAFGIGDAAKKSGCSVDTIRFYERENLLPEVRRSAGGHRFFGPEHVRRLGFIRQTRELGLGLEEIRTLLCDIDRKASDCGAIRSLLSAQASNVRRRIDELKQLESSIATLLEACGDAELGNCRIVEGMLAGEPAGSSVCCAERAKPASAPKE